MDVDIDSLFRKKLSLNGFLSFEPCYCRAIVSTEGLKPVFRQLCEPVMVAIILFCFNFFLVIFIN